MVFREELYLTLVHMLSIRQQALQIRLEDG